jgi:hypothetical protein
MSFPETRGKMKRILNLGGSLFLLLFLIQTSQALPGKKDSVAALKEKVNRNRIEENLAHLVYKDPAEPYNNRRENLRTRYARHPDCWDSAGSYIRQQLSQALGDSSLVEVLPFQHTPDDSVMYNVVGTLKGKGDGYYICCAHYDDTGRNTPGWDWRTDPAPGADDNGSGVVSVLETARVLANSKGEFPFSIKFILFSGEEFRMWGSKFYVREAVERGDNILGVINYDMIAHNEQPRMVLIANPRSQWLVELLEETNDIYEIGLILDKRIDPLADRGDHASFWDLEYDAVFGIENYPPEETNKAYDSIDDVISSDSLDYHLNFDLIARAVRLEVAALAQFTSGGNSLPDLSVSPGDIRFSPEKDRFLVTIRNLGDALVESGFWVNVSDCAQDSSAFSRVWRERVSASIPAGGYCLTLEMPWHRTVQTLFRIDVDSEDEITESDEENNTLYQGVRRVGIPTVEISEEYVYPNPCSTGQVYFHYQLSQATTVWIEVFNSLGERIWKKQIPRDLRFRDDIHYGANQGVNEVAWDCGDVSSGLYVYKISAFGKEAVDFVFGKFAVMK